MAKRVTVIDIGSNSIRMVIYEKTSRFAFHLLYETKSRVRLSEDAYANNANLQKIPMQRTIDALEGFLSISKSYKSRKTLCVATSALRDAPNKKEFIHTLRDKLKLNVKVIDGQREAYLGAMACANLLPKQNNALSIDIGGGSTEFTNINQDNVTNLLSIKLGTVRLKELFFDDKKIDEAKEFIDQKLTELKTSNIDTLIGIGGTFRAISNAIMIQNRYPLNKIHAYECSVEQFNSFIDKILVADDKELKNLYIKKSRFDIIKPGALILQRVLKKLDIKKIITSGVGVREGVYLSDLLRGSKDKFPHNYSTSVRYLLDAHINNINHSNQLSKLSKKIFDLTYKSFDIDKKYRHDLSIASRLYPTGSTVHFFSKNRHSYYFIKSALEYGYTHSQIMLIATLTRYAKNKVPSKAHIKKYSELLPDVKTINYLNYIISLSISLLSHKPRDINFDISFKDSILKVESEDNLYLSKESVDKLDCFKDIEIRF
jgi:exopolyphosphatase/guanosine-5'-triphosphate,3'-diphosphate pyrophosphatase